MPSGKVIRIPVPRKGTSALRNAFIWAIYLVGALWAGMLRAGRPDHESVENFRHDIVKSYYYYPTIADPFITVVTVRGGRIVNLERNRKIY